VRVMISSSFSILRHLGEGSFRGGVHNHMGGTWGCRSGYVCKGCEVKRHKRHAPVEKNSLTKLLSIYTSCS
jgi:hypothetical protein